MTSVEHSRKGMRRVMGEGVEEGGILKECAPGFLLCAFALELPGGNYCIIPATVSRDFSDSIVLYMRQMYSRPVIQPKSLLLVISKYQRMRQNLAGNSVLFPIGERGQVSKGPKGFAVFLLFSYQRYLSCISENYCRAKVRL